jgi:hypothetical protein
MDTICSHYDYSGTFYAFFLRPAQNERMEI